MPPSDAASNLDALLATLGTMGVLVSLYLRFSLARAARRDRLQRQHLASDKERTTTR